MVGRAVPVGAANAVRVDVATGMDVAVTVATAVTVGMVNAVDVEIIWASGVEVAAGIGSVCLDGVAHPAAASIPAITITINRVAPGSNLIPNRPAAVPNVSPQNIPMMSG